MGLKTNITILIPVLCTMFLLIPLQVAARNLKEGEVVRETNGVRDAKLVGDNGGYFVGNIPGNIGGNIIPGTGNIIPGILSVIMPGIVGGGGSFFGYGGIGYCRYGCCGVLVFCLAFGSPILVGLVFLGRLRPYK